MVLECDEFIIRTSIRVIAARRVKAPKHSTLSPIQGGSVWITKGAAFPGSRTLGIPPREGSPRRRNRLCPVPGGVGLLFYPLLEGRAENMAVVKCLTLPYNIMQWGWVGPNI
ncbi:hypothetical protein GOODEAATRI_033298 [Goodea atripinnis]|uniref:Uncharacterized protein n=1 Tax=Goodea atripinnis TaxID=208336 RepID=A0ABV0NTL1_9TELE